LGIGLRGSVLGWRAIPLGLISCAAVAAISVLAEELEQRDGSGKKAISGFAGFDADDVYYLFGPVAWFGLLLPFLIAATVGATLVALIMWWRLVQMSKQSSSPPS
ncbi:CDP-alcohol phosphatidyltransferase family protein, partial [Brasilonema sp. CT11]|nr:CDP-alcohol phosphatidyltransferase family protein [Brasilonema sp. CT11]